MTLYLLDADVFIRAQRQHYGFDICPAFWDWIKAGFEFGNVASVSNVRQELNKGKDELTAWANTLDGSFFRESDELSATSSLDVSAWVENQDYTPLAKDIFYSAADYHLITYALAHDCTVVTHEIPADSVNKIKIPNVCGGLEIDCWIHSRCFDAKTLDSSWLKFKIRYMTPPSHASAKRRSGFRGSTVTDGPDMGVKGQRSIHVPGQAILEGDSPTPSTSGVFHKSSNKVKRCRTSPRFLNSNGGAWRGMPRPVRRESRAERRSRELSRCGYGGSCRLPSRAEESRFDPSYSYSRPPPPRTRGGVTASLPQRRFHAAAATHRPPEQGGI